MELRYVTLLSIYSLSIPANLKPWKPCRDETGAYEHHEVVQRSIKLPTLVGPILYPIWHLQNAPYKVAACLRLLRKGGYCNSRQALENP